jgi:hypothetical protein
MPDGKQVRISAPSEQARLWATLCNYRVMAKQRLEASMNAVLTIRPMVGKAADPLANDLKVVARSLQTDTLEPWREIVRFKEEVNFDDGWAHSGDDSVEGMLRELNGMITMSRGGPGFIETTITPITNADLEAIPAWNSLQTIKSNKVRHRLLEQYKQAAARDGRMHSLVTVMTATGRSTSSAPTLPNIPRDPPFRALSKARPGHLILAADYGAIELRIAAALRKHGAELFPSKPGRALQMGITPHGPINIDYP